MEKALVSIAIVLLITLVTLGGALSCTSLSVERVLEQPDWSVLEDTEGTGISPGKIIVDNFTPGSSVEGCLLIWNREADERTFYVYYRVPDANRKEGFAPPPADTKDWVVIEEPYMTIEPGEYKVTPITLSLPEEVNVPPKWEFWVAMQDTKQGNVVPEMGSRWLITMRTTPIWIGILACLGGFSVVLLLTFWIARRIRPRGKAA